MLRKNIDHEEKKQNTKNKNNKKKKRRSDKEENIKIYTNLFPCKNIYKDLYEVIQNIL